jgi:hypothetical protein
MKDLRDLILSGHVLCEGDSVPDGVVEALKQMSFAQFWSETSRGDWMLDLINCEVLHKDTSGKLSLQSPGLLHVSMNLKLAYELIEHVLPAWEVRYPQDIIPRQFIQVAKDWLCLTDKIHTDGHVSYQEIEQLLPLLHDCYKKANASYNDLLQRSYDKAQRDGSDSSALIKEGKWEIAPDVAAVAVLDSILANSKGLNDYSLPIIRYGWSICAVRFNGLRADSEDRVARERQWQADLIRAKYVPVSWFE